MTIFGNFLLLIRHLASFPTVSVTQLPSDECLRGLFSLFYPNEWYPPQHSLCPDLRSGPSSPARISANFSLLSPTLTRNCEFMSRRSIVFRRIKFKIITFRWYSRPFWANQFCIDLAVQGTIITLETKLCCGNWSSWQDWGWARTNHSKLFRKKQFAMRFFFVLLPYIMVKSRTFPSGKNCSINSWKTANWWRKMRTCEVCSFTTQCELKWILCSIK